VGGKIVSEAKIRTSGSIKCEEVIDFFYGKGDVYHEFFSTWSDSQLTVLLGDYEAFEEGRAKEET
jgi:hypothetical protein